MARYFFLLAFLSGALFPSLEAQEIPDATPIPAPENRANKHLRSREGRDFYDLRLKEIRKHLEEMPEAKRQKVFEKFRKWQEMPSDEQAHLRFVQSEREKRSLLALDSIIQSNGLKLDEAQKNKLIEIYKRERRKLEEELRAEMNQQRQKRLPALQKSVVGAYQKEIAVTTASPTP